MISAKEAVVKAKDAIRNLGAAEEFPDLRLEEVMLDPEGNRWLITLGYFREKSFTRRASSLIPPKNDFIENRDYKQIEISADTGEFLGMKIRNIEA